MFAGYFFLLNNCFLLNSLSGVVFEYQRIKIINAMKQIETEITIEATAEKVWQVLTDFESYPKWNPFVRSISGTAREGEKIKVFLKPPDAKGMTFHPKVKKSEPGKEFRWKGQLGLPGIFDGEHYFLLNEISSKRTHLTHGEKFSGLLIPFMGGMIDKTREGFELMNKTLKKECERQAKPARAKKIIKKRPGTGGKKDSKASG